MHTQLRTWLAVTAYRAFGVQKTPGDFLFSFYLWNLCPFLHSASTYMKHLAYMELFGAYIPLPATSTSYITEYTWKCAQTAFFSLRFLSSASSVTEDTFVAWYYTWHTWSCCGHLLLHTTWWTPGALHICADTTDSFFRWSFVVLEKTKSILRPVFHGHQILI